MPRLFILAGPNGAGKTTAAHALLTETLACYEFVNADAIAAGLSPFNPDGMAFRAGRLMLERLTELTAARADFAFETTLATRSYIPFIRAAQAEGYVVLLVFFWLESPEIALDRVAERVAKGGHDIPPDVVRRRYARGLALLREVYLNLADEWRVYDNTHGRQDLVALKLSGEELEIWDETLWASINSQ